MLTIRNVNKAFSGKPEKVLDDINLTIQENEFFTLVGESGSGKTTLLRILAGLEREDDGEIYFKSECVSGPKVYMRPEKRHIGMVFQDYALFPHMTVYANVSFGLQHLDTSTIENRVKEVLQLVGLGSMGHRYPHQMSGGEQQRVALARALAPKPGLILMDEPYSNQDVLLKEQIRDEVRDIIKRAGASALLVTHDIRDALSIADRVGVLRRGKLLQVGKPSDLYHYPNDEYTARFLGPVNLVTMEAVPEGLRFGPLLIRMPLIGQNSGLVRVGIRPEHVIVSKCEGMPGFIPCRIIRHRFFGTHRLVHLITEVLPGLTLQAFIPPSMHVNEETECWFTFEMERLMTL